ncbi:hypothetical protein GGR57DRAFT_445983 [Xylariaceae sp. FL1272]|nr:hypothetical protein GGR57DRAFT_445983 [Xylariaceae sp. FL1272]
MEKHRDGSSMFTAFSLPEVEKFQTEFHQNGCVHSSSGTDENNPQTTSMCNEAEVALTGLSGSDSDHDELKDESPEASTTMKSESGLSSALLSSRECIEYFCGIGAVSPVTTDEPRLQFGSLIFEDNGSTAISSLQVEVEDILRQLDPACGKMQQIGGCCDSLTFLRLQGSCAQLIRMPLDTIRQNILDLISLFWTAVFRCQEICEVSPTPSQLTI